MKRKWMITALAAVSVMGISAAAEETYDDGGVLDPENPVTLTIWHYYNGDQLEAFNKLID